VGNKTKQLDVVGACAPGVGGGGKKVHEKQRTCSLLQVARKSKTSCGLNKRFFFFFCHGQKEEEKQAAVVAC